MRIADFKSQISNLLAFISLGLLAFPRTRRMSLLHVGDSVSFTAPGEPLFLLPLRRLTTQSMHCAAKTQAKKSGAFNWRTT